MKKNHFSPKIILSVIVVMILFLLLLLGALKSTDSIEIIDVKAEIITSSSGSGTTDEMGNEVIEHPYELKYTIAVKNTGFSDIGDIYESQFLEAVIIPNETFEALLNETFKRDIFEEETLDWTYCSTGVGGGVLSEHNDIAFLEVTYGLGFDESTYQYADWPAPTDEEMEHILQNAYDTTALFYISNGERGIHITDVIEKELGYFDLSVGYDGSKFGDTK